MTAKTLIQELSSMGMTQKQIADGIGAAQSSVNAWANEDRGAIRGISGDYLLKLIDLHKRVVRGNRSKAVGPSPKKAAA